MRYIRPPVVALAFTLAAGAAAFGADGAYTTIGQSLSVVSPCAAHVSIDVDPSLNASARIVATAAHPEEISQLSVAAVGHGVVVRRYVHLRECWRPAGNTSWSPTLILSIRVSPGMPISLEEGGSADYALGAVGGSLSADISGQVTLAVPPVRAKRLHT